MVLPETSLKGVQDLSCGQEVNDLIICQFSRTLEKKHSKAIGRRHPDDDERTGIFFNAIIRFLFQAGRMQPIASEKLDNLVRKGAITGNVLATMLWGLPSYPWLGI